MQIYDVSKVRTLRENELRLLGSLRFIVGPETGLIQPGLSLYCTVRRWDRIGNLAC